MNENPIVEALQEVPQRTLIAAGVALGLILLVAAILYGVKPAYAEHRKLEHKRSLVDRNSKLQQSRPASSLSELQKEVATLRSELEGDAGQVPAEQIESFVVGALDRISEEHGVQLISIQPSPSSSILMFEELPYSVSVRGSYFGLHRWLYDVEEDLRPMVVKQFEMRPSRDSGLVTLELRVVAYRTTAEDQG